MWIAKLLIAIGIACLATTQAARPNKYHKEIVDAHNLARAEVGVGPISWNNTVAAYARKYARSRLPDCEKVHSNGPYGENIAMGYGQMPGGDAVRIWVSEKPNYDYNSNDCIRDQCLHYTQVVWQNSVHVGCASVKCDNEWVFVTCNYDPPGNYIGERPY